MLDKFFDKKYVEYWKKRVGNTADGTKIPDETVLNFFISQLGIQNQDKVLDLGCGFGRLYSHLSKSGSEVWGVDVNDESLKESAKYPYQKLLKGTAEKTNLETGFFDKIVAWEVYDVVEQEIGLVEENRILKLGGIFLVTGKNNNYRGDDSLAFIAERNAKLKNFPNHFTDTLGLIKDSRLFGFEVVKAYGFEKRGDFGELKYFDILDPASPKKFYQFMLFLKKLEEPAGELPEISYEYGETAKQKAKDNKFENVKEFFKWHKETYGEKI